MPQMAPLSWLSLMIIFIMIMTIFNMLNYFIFNYQVSKTKKNEFLTKKINWKW